MPRLFRSLRFRLIVLFILIFGLIQAGLSTVALALLEGRLRSRFDGELIQRTQTMADELVKSQKRLFGPDLSRFVVAQAGVPYFRGFYVQLTDDKGKLIERSANLGQYELPLEAAGTSAAGKGQRLQTISGAEVDSLIGRGRRLRMVTLTIQDPAVRALTLQVAASLQDVQDSIADMRRFLVAGLAVGLLAAGAASWVVTGQALKRIHAVSDLARQVTPEQLGRRVPVAQRDDELDQMARHVNQMLERLEAGFAAQERFIHDASHELKTPLSVLLSQAQVLQAGKPNVEEAQRFASSVEQEARHLGRLVESLLVLVRAEGRAAVAQRAAAGVNDAVVAAVRECDPLARSAGVPLTVRLPEAEGEEEMLFAGDPELISAMIANLIRNAVRFSPPGQEVLVEVARRERQAVVRVSDRGPGVPPQELGRIFERFSQGSNNHPRRGTGLGLAIARGIARLHGGDVTAVNRDSGGCEFTATIPLHVSDSRRD